MWTHRPINSYVKLQGDLLPLAKIFLLQACKKSRILVKSAIDLKSVVISTSTSVAPVSLRRKGPSHVTLVQNILCIPRE